MSAEPWRSVHIHRYGLQDEFLVEAVAPVLADLRDAVPAWFFLRYWQGGHHIRLRMRTDADTLDAVTGKLAAYLAEHPSGADFDADEFRAAQPTMAALEDERVDDVLPADTIRPARYTPELHKYGGERGVRAAERFFHASSEVVLDTLSAAAGNSGRRLGAGFSMMLRGLLAAGRTPAQMAAFFRHYCLLWAPYTFDQFLDAWPALLEARAPVMRAHAESVLEARLDGDPFHDAVRETWAAVDDDVLDAVTLAGADAPRERREQVLLVSYLHTHNNRLGLIPEHESFLGFLGHHVLSECAGATPADDLPGAVREHREQRLGAS
ncbi:thiopeptide-type bacteriocin biosynthesis protein [Actinokineospora sp. UTMC 2448]|uniref:thiopeptide-type bacteriocin biosynthesis protein n=1 Tax=Actinokineospora sp. UTMC 2448 TaxID=2268449 RepID=UPI002164B378|nr:thiopeptide-type bacteriocin biosynthesis protein [Actinokineospora sp. UTMC 2448]UVS78673.1 Dehydratase PerD [Actinokineospora sp. UTMC 2448]